MAKFLFTYRMPSDYVPGRPEVLAAWTAWFEGMGASLVDPGNPIWSRARSAIADLTRHSAGTP
jgi:hypothetical protein